MTLLRKSRKRRGIDYSKCAHPKVEREKPYIKVYADGREVLNLKTVSGRLLYGLRITEMWERQGFKCSIIGELIPRIEATFEHGNGRAAGKRDDRIDIVDADGFYINSAACALHNCAKGSRRDYPVKVRVRAI